MSAGTYDVCVIGSGAGGLGAAVLLAKSGVKTLMLERHWQVGGCITSFKRKGFSFDPGASMFSKKMTTMVLDMVGMTQRVDLTLIPVKSPGLRFHSAKADIRLSEGMNTSEVVAQFPDLKTKQSSAVERVIDEAVSVASLENAPPMSLLQWLQDNSIDPAISIVIYMPSYFLLVQPPSNSPVRIGSSIASLASIDLCYPRGGVV
jgi:protoporphyrinogen oxidase